MPIYQGQELHTLPPADNEANRKTLTEFKHYQCNYCGFTGSSMHSCIEYIKTLNIVLQSRRDIAIDKITRRIDGRK